MAKLNKGQALEAMVNRILTDGCITDEKPEILRMMDHQQRRDSAARYISYKHGGFINNVVQVYRLAVIEHGITVIVNAWVNRIREFEATDPTIVADRKARAFVYMVDRMLSDATERLAKFREQFDINPAYAFTSTAAVQAAGDLEIATRVKKMLETMTPDEIKSELVDRMQYDGGLRLEGSTCPMTNLVDRAKGIAIAKLAGLKS
jgi:hypothetical protein